MAERITLGDPSVGGPANPGDGRADFDIPLSPPPSPDWQEAFRACNLRDVPVSFHEGPGRTLVLRVTCSSFELEDFLTRIRSAVQQANDDMLKATQP